MSIYRIQGEQEKQRGIYYEFDSNDKPLGEGGMGKVFKGREVNEHNGSVRNVAVKFMYADLPPFAIEKARREAAIQLRHENLVEMLGFIETESKNVLGESVPHYHVVSELLEGVTLEHLLEGRTTDQYGNRVAFAEKMWSEYKSDVNRFAVEVIKSILSGLITMHDAKYIHRDIAPSNIMLTVQGRIKLIDFGIAKKIGNLTSHDKHLTMAGQFVGRPEYAAPELVLGKIDEQNQTTDIYAVGILLFQCIVGHVPFEGDCNDVMQKQQHAKMPLHLVKHHGLRKIIYKATEKSRSKRYQSAAEFRVALEQLDLNNYGSTIIDGLQDTIRNPYLVKGTVAVASIVAAIMCFVFFSNKEETIVEPTEPTYSTVIKSLHESKEPETAIMQLRKLSDKGDADASFMLSRLLFSSKLEDDYCPDSVRLLQKQLHISSDNEEAHRMLHRAVEQNPRNYAALYELACDYWKASQRTEAVKERDGAKAELYFTKARKLAEEAGATNYVQMSDEYLNMIGEWKEIIAKMNEENSK